VMVHADDTVAVTVKVVVVSLRQHRCATEGQ